MEDLHKKPQAKERGGFRGDIKLRRYPGLNADGSLGIELQAAANEVEAMTQRAQMERLRAWLIRQEERR